MTMLRVYMDASSSSKQQYCTVAGYYAHAETWDNAFDKPWRAELQAQGISRFHATDAFSRIPRDEYEGWDKTRIKAHEHTLLSIIQECDITPFAVMVSIKDWDSQTVDEKWRLLLTEEENRIGPLFAALKLVIQMISADQPGVPISYMFDREEKPGNIAATFDAVIKWLEANGIGTEHITSGIGFCSSKILTPLQAADLLAHQCNTYCEKADGRNKPMPF